VDYALPRSWHPLRYIWRPLLARLEPFALDLWRDEIAKWLPRIGASCLRKTTFFGGLYQKVVITRWTKVVSRDTNVAPHRAIIDAGLDL
jgi:hypothetical protein